MTHNLLLVAVLFVFQVFKPWAALLNPMKMEKDVTCREVVITANATRGRGVIGSPYRRIVEVWEKDGTKIAEHDPSPELLTYTDALDFAKWCQSKDCPSGPLRMDMLAKWLEITRS